MIERFDAKNNPLVALIVVGKGIHGFLANNVMRSQFISWSPPVALGFSPSNCISRNEGFLSLVWKIKFVLPLISITG